MHNSAIAAFDERARSLLDRHDILAVLVDYCSAIDRRDHAALTRVFHHDAVVEHGLYRGNVQDFVEWVIARQDAWDFSQHAILNTDLILEADSARSETQFLCLHVRKGESKTRVSVGRYIDRFERRRAVWRLTSRSVVTAWSETFERTSHDHGGEA